MLSLRVSYISAVFTACKNNDKAISRSKCDCFYPQLLSENFPNTDGNGNEQFPQSMKIKPFFKIVKWCNQIC